MLKGEDRVLKFLLLRAKAVLRSRLAYTDPISEAPPLDVEYGAIKSGWDSDVDRRTQPRSDDIPTAMSG